MSVPSRVLRHSDFKTQCPVDNVIHLFTGGSNLHGAKLPGKNDLDIYGIFIEPKINLYGLTPFDHYVTSTSEEGERNTPEDTDLTLYSLKRWAGLALRGNPTALSFLFTKSMAPNSWMWNGYYSDCMKYAVLAKSAAKHYTGFVNAQMARLLGEKGLGKHGQRPELGNQHGYDTKAAMHAVRLLGEGRELLETGHITFPRPNVEELLNIRQGALSLDRVSKTVSQMIGELEDAMLKSPLPDLPDRDRVNALLVESYRTFYTHI